jgi:hypothetical protein
MVARESSLQVDSDALEQWDVATLGAAGGRVESK